MDALVGDGVLASGDAHGVRVGGEVEVIDFNASYASFRELLAWTLMKRSACALLAIAVRVSSGIKVSSERV